VKQFLKLVANNKFLISYSSILNSITIHLIFYCTIFDQAIVHIVFLTIRGVTGECNEEVWSSKLSNVCHGIMTFFVHVSWRFCKWRWQYNMLANIRSVYISIFSHSTRHLLKSYKWMYSYALNFCFISFDENKLLKYHFAAISTQYWLNNPLK